VPVDKHGGAFAPNANLVMQEDARYKVIFMGESLETKMCIPLLPFNYSYKKFDSRIEFPEGFHM
jgi:hypothetical protein